MKLFIYELKKIFRRKFLLLILALLFCLNMFNIWQNYSVYSHNVNAEINQWRWVFYEKMEGLLTTQKVKWLIDYNEEMTACINNGTGTDKELITGNTYGEMNISNEFVEEVTRIYNYNSEIEQLKKDNIEKRQNAVLHGNIYLQRCADKIDKTYGERRIDSLYNYSAFETYFGYSFSSFLIIIIQILAFAPLFAGEYETGMHLCFMASENGRKKTSRAKIGAMSVFSLTTCVLFAICDLLMFYFCARLRGFSAPIYALESFKFSSLTCSIGGFILILFCVKFLGFLTLGFIYSLLSSIFHKGYEVFVSGLALTFGFMFLSAYSKGFLDFINTVNPINLIVGYKMFSSFDVINMFSLPMWRWTVTLVFCLIFAVLLFVSVNAVNNKNARRKKK